jgi:cytochrome b
MALTEYRVWDRTQRIFHWVNFVAVLALAAIGTVILNADTLGIPDDPGMVILKTTHVYVGYVFIANLLWRLVWLFIGSPFARWSALLPAGPKFGSRLAALVRSAFSGTVPFYIGHNPLARIVLTLLVSLLVVQGITGLVLAGTDVYMAPFGDTMREWVAADTHDPALVRPYSPETVNAAAYAEMRAFRSPIVETHELTFFVLLTLIAIHVAAAVFAEFQEGGSIISAMFTGRKISARAPVDAAQISAATVQSREEPPHRS